MGGSFWLAGRWAPPGYASPIIGGDSLTDIYGQTLTVGCLVKLVGIVTAMNEANAHFQDVTFRPYFPDGGIGSNQSFSAHPQQLVKVADHI